MVMWGRIGRVGGRRMWGRRGRVGGEEGGRRWDRREVRKKMEGKMGEKDEERKMWGKRKEGNR